MNERMNGAMKLLFNLLLGVTLPNVLFFGLHCGFFERFERGILPKSAGAGMNGMASGAERRDGYERFESAPPRAGTAVGDSPLHAQLEPGCQE